MHAEELESVKPLHPVKMAAFRVAALYFVGTVALVATVIFLLKNDAPAEIAPQFGSVNEVR